MSFDLFVLLDKTSAETQHKWIKKLKQSGIEAQFPKGFVIGKEAACDTVVQCRLTPPLVSKTTEFEAYEFNFDFSELNDELRQELSDSTEDESIQQLVQSMTSELQLYSQAGRSDHALIIQCFAAACLADAADGLLLDPQEFGLVKGSQAYAVAQTHCQYEISQGFKAELEAGQQKTDAEPCDAAKKIVNKQQDSKKERKKEGKKGVSVILLILLFIALRNFFMN
ncbi:hypothetical protein [Marinicella rhabdoformis]|uniref:hypothetical protein n=1 Tax=Marinicella rhabdoformis TaxID=2580566 RepID=UPI0012AEDAFB|nr:hypothetical protein [Marinicella rhabdoformis]